MPAAIPIIIQAVGYYIGANALVLAVVVIAASYAVSNYQKRKAARAARDAYNASLEDRLVMSSTSNGARSRLYGRVRNTDGILFKGTWGPNQQNYTFVVAVAGHEVDGIEQIFLNDIPITADVPDGEPISGGAVGGQGYFVTTLPFGKTEVTTNGVPIVVSGGVGAVVLPHTPIASSVYVVVDGTESSYTIPFTLVGNTVSVASAPDGTWQVGYQYNRLTAKVRIWRYLGAPGQTLYPLLNGRFPGLLTTNDKFSGTAIVVMELVYDQDVFPTGVPSLTAVVRGAKILDTRTGITAWSENPAMIARDWALYKYGGAMTTADLNDASFQQAANACDVSTVFSLDNGTTETRPLYQCGIVCKTDISPEDHFGEIVESMAGGFGFAGGQMKVKAGVYRAPVAAMTDVWLNDNGNVIVTKDPSKQDIVNTFKPVISNAGGYIDGSTLAQSSSVSYTATPMPAAKSATYIAADGQELIRETTMLGVTRSVHAQHICEVQMRDMRDALTVQLTGNMRAWTLELFDVVTLTLPVFGFSNKEFEVIGWKYSMNNGVELVLKETSAAIFAVGTGLGTLDLAQNTTLPVPWVVEQITGVSVTSTGSALVDGFPTSRVEVTWNAVTNDAIRQSGYIEVQYTLAENANDESSWIRVTEQGNATSTVIVGLMSNRAYVFRVRAANTLGVRGKWSVQVSHIVNPPPTLTEYSAALTGSAVSVIGASGTWPTYAAAGFTYLGDLVFSPSFAGDGWINFNAKVSYSGTPSSGPNFGAFTQFWIDFNGDNIPTANEQLVVNGESIYSPATPTSGTYTISARIPRAFTTTPVTWKVYVQKFEGTMTLDTFSIQAEVSRTA